MNRKYLCAIEPENNTTQNSLMENKNFTDALQTAVLLSLFEKGQLTKWQFDYCIEKLNVSD